MDDVIDELMQRGLCSQAHRSAKLAGVIEPTLISGAPLDEANRRFVRATDRGPCYVKFGTGGASASIDLLEYEAAGLTAMAEAAPTLRIPKPWLVGKSAGGESYIVMDYIKFGRRGASHLLGEGLAQMHAAPNDMKTFGFSMDGCCGAHPQLNNPEGQQLNWIEFWRDFRLGPQLDSLAKSYPNDQEIQELGARVKKEFPLLFRMLILEDIRPSLLHGDLWGGNIGYETNNGESRPVLFDPACYYGHSEAEFGIGRMFGGLDREAMSSYHEIIPKENGFEDRQLLYELHHSLNHYNIFGSGYRSSCVSLMRRIIRATKG